MVKNYLTFLSCLVSALALTGCGSFNNNAFGLLPDGYRLSDSAKAIRASTPPPADMPRELDKQVSGPYIVEPGDVLLVQPASLDSPVRLPGDQPVLADGTIQLGKYGRYLAAGKPMEIIEREINDQIRRDTADAGSILVRLVARESKVFYVIGEVNAPGVFPLRGRETVLDALLAAGGLNSNASKRKIILSRPTAPDSCRVVLPVRFNDIVQLGDTTTNYQIRAGDRLYVPSRSLHEELAQWFGKDNDPHARPQVGCPVGPVTHLGPVPEGVVLKAAPVLPKPGTAGPTPNQPWPGTKPAPTPTLPNPLPTSSTKPTTPTSNPPSPTPAAAATPLAGQRPAEQPVNFQAPRLQPVPSSETLNAPPPPLTLPPVMAYRPGTGNM
jgi:protein involved in polysaccharide export with SLBB domain